MVHTLKIEKSFADAILCGDKNFEIRRNDDRGFQKGDEVVFQTVEKGLSTGHPLNGAVYEITYVMSGFGLQPNWVVFGIRRKDGG